jgi:hypothetical protein
MILTTNQVTPRTLFQALLDTWFNKKVYKNLSQQKKTPRQNEKQNMGARPYYPFSKTKNVA